MFSIPRTRSRRLLKLLNLIIELAIELYLTTAARDLFDAIWNFPAIDLINSFCCWKSSVVTSLDESSRKIRSARWMSVTSVPRKEKKCANCLVLCIFYYIALALSPGQRESQVDNLGLLSTPFGQAMGVLACAFENIAIRKVNNLSP